MKEKAYHADLARQEKYWIPYEKCSSEEYFNQKQRIKAAILELVHDKCLFDVIVEDKEDNPEYPSYYYKKRLGNHALNREELTSNILKSLEKYRPGKETLEEFITSRIPRKYLVTYYALNELGKVWKKDSSDCRQEASSYVYEEYIGKFQNEELGEDLYPKMTAELDHYDPEKGLLGSFVVRRMRLRLADLRRKEIKEKVSRRIVPQNGMIGLKATMKQDTVRVRNRREVALPEELQDSTYYVGKDYIQFPSSDIGKKVTIVYFYDDKNFYVKEEKTDALAGADLKLLEKLLHLTAQNIKFKGESRKVEYKRQMRKGMCLSERTVQLLKKIYEFEDLGLEYEYENNTQVDIRKAVVDKYLNFFLKGEVPNSYEEFFDEVKKMPLKHLSEIPLLQNEKDEELKFGKKGWLPSKVPIAFLLETENEKITAATVTGFRQDYMKEIRSRLHVKN